ncbi:hypothetical protein EOG18_23715 [Salmonella enterica]|nr:hypothetical protein [Salmonella enterica]EJR6791245.1 hypothetical protein [Salmonella enterica]
MTWRILLVLTFVGLLCVAGYGAYAQFADLNLLSYDGNNKPVLLASGFSVVLSAWPVALAGGVAGATLMYLVAFTFSSAAQDLDHEAERKRLRQHLAAAERRADEADIRAETRLQRQVIAAEEREQQALAETASARQYRQEAEEYVRKMTAETEQIRAATAQAVALARTAALDAEKRRRNAAGAAERRRRKLERIAPGEPDDPERDLMEFIHPGGR